jgi:hypothetical protein
MGIEYLGGHCYLVPGLQDKNDAAPHPCSKGSRAFRIAQDKPKLALFEPGVALPPAPPAAPPAASAANLTSARGGYHNP